MVRRFAKFADVEAWVGREGPFHEPKDRHARLVFDAARH
jgi:hypothetical protein